MEIKNILKFLLSCLIFCSIGCGGNGGTNDSNENDEFQSGVIPTVEVVHPIVHEFESDLVITGTLKANKEVQLHAMEGGYLKSIKYDIGDKVNQGDVIAELENPELYSDFKKAEADFKVKESIYNRLKGIYEKTPDLTSVEDMERAQADYESTKAMKEALEIRISYLNVKAPFSGIITNRYVDRGAMIQKGINNPNAAPIVDIKEMLIVRLVVAYPESDISLVHKGDSVQIDFPELPGNKYWGVINRMAGALNPTTKTMKIEIDLKNDNRELKPGMYATVTIRRKGHEGALAVPVNSYTSLKDQNYIYKVVNSKVVMIPVTVGIYDKDYIEILDADVTAEDWVIVQGKEQVSNGLEVKVSERKN